MSQSHRGRIRFGAFALIELTVAIAVIGVAAVVLMQLLAFCSKGDSQLSDSATLMNVARNGQEYVHSLSYSDLQAWSAGSPPTFTAPIDAAGNAIALPSGKPWSQTFTIAARSRDNLTASYNPGDPGPVYAVTVTASTTSGGQTQSFALVSFRAP